MPKTEITYEIIEQIGILKENKSGWQREVNIVKWNNGKPKLDIRDWGPDHQKVGKGISLISRNTARLKHFSRTGTSRSSTSDIRRIRPVHTDYL